MIPSSLAEICKLLTLYHIDRHWSEYLDQVEDVRESIHLRRIGGQNPFFEFQKLSIQLFDELQNRLDDNLIDHFNSIDPATPSPDMADLGIKKPSVMDLPRH